MDEGVQKNEKTEENKLYEVEFKNLLNKSNYNHNDNETKIIEKVSNNDNSKVLRTNKKLFENILPETLVKSQKRYSNIENICSNFKFVSNKKAPAKSLKINDQDYYKNFFMLTYQAFKLNSENTEVFDYVKIIFILFYLIVET